MKYLLIVLAVIIFFVVGFVLFGRQRGNSKRQPYTLDSLSKEELLWLITAYNDAISPKTCTFRGGGVWRSEATPEQKNLQTALILGRMDEAQLEMLIEFVNRASKGTSEPLVEEVMKSAVAS